CLSAKRTTWNEFSCSMTSAIICLATGVETPLFTSILVQPPIDPLPPALQDQPSTPNATPPQDQPSTPHASSPQEQPTTTSKSFMPLLTTLMETSEQESNEARKKKKSNSSGLKRLKKRKIEAIDADEDITLVDMEKDEEVISMDDETQGRLNQEDVSVIEPTVFDDEDVTMTMALTLIKLKAEKAKLLDEQIAQRLHDEEV
nr:hypothetical protein [Tanacetum cinerariifolium]